MGQNMKAKMNITMLKWLSAVFALSFMVLLCTACPGSGSGPSVPEVTTVYLNQRLQLIFPESSGSPSLTLNGNTVKDATFTASSVYFNVTVEALGGKYLETAEAIVQVDGKQVLKKSLKILNEVFAGSELVVFTQDLDKAGLEAQLNELNKKASLMEGFSLKPDSFQFVEQSGSGTALINIGRQTTEEAVRNLKLLGENSTISASPNLLYSISGRKGVYWTSPRCDLLDELDTYANNDWKLLKKADLFALLGVDKAHQQNLKGGGVTIPILDTGINNGDVFDCSQTVFKEGHGTHIFNLADSIAEDAGVGSETSCDPEGFCSTEAFVKTLIDLENRYLTSGKKVIVNLSVSGSRGLDDSIDRAIWAQLKYYEETYPNFLIIAAAGNHGLISDESIANSPAYPASFSDAVPQTKEYAPLRNIISVGAVGVKADTNKVEVSATNPKGIPVDILAPGIRICWEDDTGTCAPNRGTEGLTGSSFATALVSGVAAIMWSACQDMTAQELRAILKEQATPVEGSDYKLLNANPTFTANAKCKSNNGPRLEPGTQQTGVLGLGQQEEYKFIGYFNTPMLFTVAPTGAVRIDLEIYDSRGNKELDTLGCSASDSCSYDFTPQKDEEFTIRLIGDDGDGAYAIYNDYIAGLPSERNIVKPLELDKEFTGFLAGGAYDEYSLTGFTNQNLRFTLRSEATCLNAIVFDFLGTNVFEVDYCNDLTFNFTPSSSQPYKVRIFPSDIYRSWGSYSFFVQAQ